MNQNSKTARTQIQDLQPAEHERPAQQPRELSDSELRLAAGGTYECTNYPPICEGDSSRF